MSDSTFTGDPVTVGLVGAGPWAAELHAPMLADGPETRLTAVWARRPEAAAELAARHGARAVTRYEELFDHCEAVAFAVPPDVQAEMAPAAARAGKALLLEKPIGLDLAGARRVVDAVEEAGVVSQVVLTKRYHPLTQRFIDEASSFEATGARSAYLHGAFLGGKFATPWRLAHGALLDLGPHLLDLLIAALGPIEDIRGAGDPRRWVEITSRHASGVVSQASLSGAVSLSRSVTSIELYGTGGSLEFDANTIDHDECPPILRREFATAVRSGTGHPLDARHGLMLQELLQRATDSL